jgi:hypothetical protein
MSSSQPLIRDDDNGDSRQSQGNQELIAEIIQQNAMKELTTVEMTLEFWPGLMILFSIAFGPTFIALTVTEVFTVNSQQLQQVNGLVLGVILVFFVINAFSIQMLNTVYKQKKLGSFQEMAWSTSLENRGYIFLISAMKVIYLVVTSAYCISFIACFLTGLIQLTWTPFKNCNDTGCNSHDLSLQNWGSYGIYAFWVLVLSTAAFEFQKDKQPDKIYEYKLMPKIFFLCVVISLVGAVIGLLCVCFS